MKNELELDAWLERLESAELIRRLYDLERAYLIKHALLQETATASLLLQERKRLNRLVGECLEELYADRLDEHAVRLAHHFEAAGEDAKAHRYYLRAGELGLRTNALAEAAQHFSRALEIAQRANLPALDAYLQRGRVAELQGRFDEAVAIYREMYEWGERRGERAVQLGALIAEATIHSIPSPTYDQALAQQLSDRALVLAREAQDPRAEAKILWNLMLLNSRVGSSARQAIAYGEQALAIAAAHNLEEQLTYLWNDMAPLYAYFGQMERAEEFNRRARANWRAWKNMPMLTDNLSYGVMIHLLGGRFDDAIRESDEAYETSREIGNRWGEAFSRTWIGEAFQERGEIGTALERMQSALALQDAFPPVRLLTRADLARLYGAMGAAAQGISVAEQAVQVGDELFPALKPTAVAALAHCLILQGDLARAARVLASLPEHSGKEFNPLFELDQRVARLELYLATGETARAFELAAGVASQLERDQHRQFLVSAWRLYALAYAQRGEWDHAVDLLERARRLGEQMRAYWSLWQVLAAFADVAQQRGDAGAAAQYRAQAREWVEYIAARTPDTPLADGTPSLRLSFLESARVKRLK